MESLFQKDVRQSRTYEETLIAVGPALPDVGLGKRL